MKHAFLLLKTYFKSRAKFHILCQGQKLDIFIFIDTLNTNVLFVYYNEVHAVGN